jgi:hypothetical protein
MDWIDLAQDRDQGRALESRVMNLRVPLNVRIFLGSCTTGGFSRKAQLRGVSYAFLHHHTDVSIQTDLESLLVWKQRLYLSPRSVATMSSHSFYGPHFRDQQCRGQGCESQGACIKRTLSHTYIQTPPLN